MFSDAYKDIFKQFLFSCIFMIICCGFLFFLISGIKDACSDATYKEISVEVLSADKTDTFLGSEYRVAFKYANEMYYSRNMDDYYLCKDKVGQTIKAELKTVEYSDTLVTNTIEEIYVD